MAGADETDETDETDHGSNPRVIFRRKKTIRMCSVSSVVLPRVVPDDHPSVNFVFPIRATVALPASGKPMFAACSFESLTPELYVCGFTTAFALFVNYNFPYLRDVFLPRQPPEEHEWDVTLVVANLEVTTYQRKSRVLTKMTKEFVLHLPGQRSAAVHPANANFVLTRDEILRGEIGAEKRVFLVSIRDDMVLRLCQPEQPFQFVLGLSDHCWAMLGQPFFVTSMSAEFGAAEDPLSSPVADDRLFFETPACLLSAAEQRRVAAVFKDIYPLDSRWYHPLTGRSLLSAPATLDASEPDAEVRATLSLNTYTPPGFDTISGFETTTRGLLFFGNDEDLNPGNRDVMHVFFMDAEQHVAVPLREVLAELDVFLNGVSLAAAGESAASDTVSVPVPRASWFRPTVEPAATAALMFSFRRKRREGGGRVATLVPHALFVFSKNSLVLLRDKEGEVVYGARVLAAATNCSVSLQKRASPPPLPHLPLLPSSSASAHAPALPSAPAKKNPKKKTATEFAAAQEETSTTTTTTQLPEWERARKLCASQSVYARNLEQGTAFCAPQHEKRVYVSRAVYNEWINKLAAQIPQIMNAELLRRKDKLPVDAPVLSLVKNFCVSMAREHLSGADFLTEKTFLQISGTLSTVLCRLALACVAPEDLLDIGRFERAFFRFLVASERQLLHPFRVGVMRAVLSCPDIPWVADAKAIANQFFVGVTRSVASKIE